MLVRTSTGCVNLATINEAELRDDGSVTLFWAASHKRYTGRDALLIRAGLEQLAVKLPVPDPELPFPPAEEEVASPVLKLHPEQPTAVAEDLHEPDAPALTGHTSLSRRVAQVLTYEPIASLTPKHREAFLAAVEKATDFAHLPPRYRKLIEQADAARRSEQRQ